MVNKILSSTFSSLTVRNYRLYFMGQAVSLCGTWIQVIALGWLVLELTGSGTKLGTVFALHFSPILFLSLWGGTISDRYSKRKLICITQSAYCFLALTMGLLILTGMVRMWIVYIFALSWGLVNIIDNPARHSFMAEVVSSKHMVNAVSLNAVEVNLARVVGPAIGGFLITKIGIAACFVVNALSFVAILIVLFSMNASELLINKKSTDGTIKEGLLYVKKESSLFYALIMILIVGSLTYEFPVTLPLLAKFTFNGDANLYASMTMSLGLGAILGGLIAAGRENISPRKMVFPSFCLGLAMALLAVSQNLVLTILAIFVVGLLMTIFLSIGNATLQLNCNSEMRGRVMALWSMALLGSTLIGGPIVGWVGETFSPGHAMALGGGASVFVSILGLIKFKK